MNEAIGLLREAKAYYLPKCDLTEAYFLRPETVMEKIGQALAALEKPAVCELCRGSGQVPGHNGIPCGRGCQGHVSHPCEECGRQWTQGQNPTIISCPRCKPTGQEANFTKAMRSKHKHSIKNNLCVGAEDFEKALAENDRLEAEVKGLGDGAFQANVQFQIHEDRIEEIEVEKKRLEEALVVYGMHLDSCPCYVPDGNWKDNCHRTKTLDELNIEKRGKGFVTTLKCTCGFGQALQGQKEEE